MCLLSLMKGIYFPPPNNLPLSNFSSGQGEGTGTSGTSIGTRYSTCTCTGIGTGGVYIVCYYYCRFLV